MARVLLIEDEKPLLRILAALLIEAGFEVASAEDGAAAIEKLGAYQPDLIVFNTIIEGGEKQDMIARLRGMAPNAKVVDVSLEKNRVASGVIETIHSPAEGTDGIDGTGATGSSAAPVGSDGVGASGADAYLNLPLAAAPLIDLLRKLAPASADVDVTR